MIEEKDLFAYLERINEDMLEASKLLTLDSSDILIAELTATATLINKILKDLNKGNIK